MIYKNTVASVLVSYDDWEKVAKNNGEYIYCYQGDGADGWVQADVYTTGSSEMRHVATICNWLRLKLRVLGRSMYMDEIEVMSYEVLGSFTGYCILNLEPLNIYTVFPFSSSDAFRIALLGELLGFNTRTVRLSSEELFDVFFTKDESVENGSEHS